MRCTWLAVGLGVLLAAPVAMAHELECVKEVNGETFLEVQTYPATLTYTLTVRNIHRESPSEVLEASDALLEGLGFGGFDTPFTLALRGEETKTFDVVVNNEAECLALANRDGTQDNQIHNTFNVRWDNGSDVCSADVRCLPEGDVEEGMRMTGGGSVFGRGNRRVTHGFQLRCEAENDPQSLEVNWEGNRFHLTDLLTADCQDTALDERPPTAGFDTYIGTGVGRYNGVDGATISFTFTDAGEPGSSDTARIVIRDAGGNVVLSVDGNLNFGNHQAHR